MYCHSASTAHKRRTHAAETHTLQITLLLTPEMYTHRGRVKTECDGTRAETRFGLPAKRTSPFISAGLSVQSAAGSRGVRISGSNAG